ncbi:MAG TPA: hypothetical protein VNU47_01580 [Candidatus Paceibacterota bacterium]|nr:hypothetical protein [Candidatus Paceibacterota bacterium]
MRNGNKKSTFDTAIVTPIFLLSILLGSAGFAAAATANKEETAPTSIVVAAPLSSVSGSH